MRLLRLPNWSLVLVLLAAPVLMGLATVSLPARAPVLTPAKLGFDYMSKEQEKDLWRRADQYAMAEAFLKRCGKPSYVERRMLLAAQACIKPEALRKVAAYFRNKVREMETKHQFVCDTAEAVATIRSVRLKIDSDVNEVASMCRSCFFC